MADREKVIERLGRVSYYFKTLLAVGWQGDSDIYREHRESVNMALALLKEQEPRVLTYDELMALPHGEETNVPVVIEEKYPVETWDKGTQCKWVGARFAQEMAQDHFWHNQDTYNKIWRVWTALPSKKQRKAVKWE